MPRKSARPGVGIVWGVLKNEAAEEPTQAGRHPREQSGGPRVDSTTSRASFADLPRREIHLYASQADWRTGRPGLTVYYLGVPDTAPEFTSEAALEAYLARPRPPGR